MGKSTEGSNPSHSTSLKASSVKCSGGVIGGVFAVCSASSVPMFASNSDVTMLVCEQSVNFVWTGIAAAAWDSKYALLQEFVRVSRWCAQPPGCRCHTVDNALMLHRNTVPPMFSNVSTPLNIQNWASGPRRRGMLLSQSVC